jgi:HEPN domain-containing protein
MKEEAKKWIDFAYEDLAVARLILHEKIYNQVCFHSQQCVEKVLKGFIEAKEEMYPKTHKLADLLTALGNSPFDEIADDILLLDRFYIPTRYPNALPGSLPDSLPGEIDAKEALKTAEAVFEIAQKEIGRI